MSSGANVLRSLSAVLLLAASSCMVHVQAGAGGASTGSGGAYGGTTYVAPEHRPVSANPPPQPVLSTVGTPQTQSPSDRRLTILHPTPTGGVTRDSTWIAKVHGQFGGPTGFLRGIVYYIPNDTMTMPDVSFMKPQAVVYTDSLNIDVRDYTEPVAGSGRYEFYAVQYTGTFNASKAGPYQFGLSSSDGSRVYIDDKLVVDDDGRHLPKTAYGTVTLTPGQHTIRVDYFKAYRWVVALQLWVTPPGGQGEVFKQNL